MMVKWGGGRAFFNLLIKFQAFGGLASHLRDVVFWKNFRSCSRGSSPLPLLTTTSQPISCIVYIYIYIFFPSPLG